MKIIRDEEMGGLAMIPLFADWNVRRCNVEGCCAKPTTIIVHDDGAFRYGLCEEHFQQANAPGGTTLDLVWDDFDAFKSDGLGKELR